MKVLILAGGFAKRMGKLGENTPKSLLPIAGKPVIEHILDKIRLLDNVTSISVSTNKKFEEHFNSWINESNSKNNIDLLVEPAMDEGQKLGSIGAVNYFVNQEHVDEDLLVINGDNLFEFDLAKFMNFQNERGTFAFGVYDTKSIDEARKLGVVLSDQNGLVMDFEEKPANPKSTTVSTGIYFFPKNVVPQIKQYIDEGNSADRMGDLLIWIRKSQDIHAFVFSEPWFDIGSPDTYKQAEEKFHAS